MFDLDLYQFADTRTSGSQIPYHEIPFHVAILLQLALQKLVVSIADNVLQEIFLLHLDRFQLHLFFSKECQILVYPLDAQIDGLRLEVLHQIALVGHQAFMCHAFMPGMIVLYCPEIRCDRIGRQVGLSQVVFKRALLLHGEYLRTIIAFPQFQLYGACVGFSYYEKVGIKVVNIDDEIPFGLPDGWAFVRLKELWELISGRDLSHSEYNAVGSGIPYITGASNFVDGKVELVRWTTSPQVKTETGDLLLTCKGTVGEMAFNTFGSAHIARQIMAIRNIFDLNSEYLALCMDFYINAIKSKSKGLIPGISREDIQNLILPVPPLSYQVRVIERVASLTNILTSIEQSLN